VPEPTPLREPFDGFDDDLSFETVSDRTATVSVPAPGLPADEASRRLVVYLGLFDRLTEALVDAAPEEDAPARLAEVLRRVQAADGPLRFALHQEREATERRELMTRMRGKEIAVTRDWMMPKLREEIERYEARVAALQHALAGSIGEAGS